MMLMIIGKEFVHFFLYKTSTKYEETHTGHTYIENGGAWDKITREYHHLLW